MKYDNQELINYLAAEYVLGTLTGGARKRFSRLLMTSSYAREATYQWERHLNTMGTQLPHESPNAEVWKTIINRIDGATLKAIDSQQQSRTTLHWLWPTLTAVSLAACLILAVTLMPTSTPEDPRFASDQFALVKDEQQQSLWLIDVTSDQLIVKASEQFTAQPDKDYELWMIVKTQDAPISLGLLPKSGTAYLPVRDDFTNGNIKILAVSLEPIGGSPTGTPTKVLYTTELVNI